ncbi:2-oxoacid:acceptor oxidoreductase family protein [Streptomyces sp. NPDC001076]
MAFCRIDDRPIRVREPVTRPDALVVQDATLPHQVNVFEGLRPWGSPARAEPRVGGDPVLVNSPRGADDLGLGTLTGLVVTVPATALALRHVGRPVPGAVLLGGLAALTGCVTIDSLAVAVQDRPRPSRGGQRGRGPGGVRPRQDRPGGAGPCRSRLRGHGRSPRPWRAVVPR